MFTLALALAVAIAPPQTGSVETHASSCTHARLVAIPASGRFVCSTPDPDTEAAVQTAINMHAIPGLQQHHRHAPKHHHKGRR